MPTNRPQHDASRARRWQKPPDYFARRQQYRLIGLVFSLLLVCFLIVEASKPKNWQWLLGAESSVAQNLKNDGDESLDTKLGDPLPPRAPLADGVFVSPANLRGDAEEVAKVGVDGVERSERPARDPPGTDADSPPPGPTSVDYAAIKDDTIFRAVEAAAWYKLLKYLNNVDNNQLQAASLGPVSFAQLHQSPAAFRGRVIELVGHVRRAHYLDAPKNDFGIEGYWQCWLFPANSLNPIVVYALELPDGFPHGMKLRERVEFTGVFFKRWAYASKSGSRVAPLVIAGRGCWQPEPKPVTRFLPDARQIATIVGACALLAVTLAWLVNRLAQWNRPGPLAEGPLTVAIDNDDDLKSVEEATEGFLGDLESSDAHE